MSSPSKRFNPGRSSSNSPEWRVPLSEPSFGAAEIEAAKEVLESGWWTMGPVSGLLEQEFARAVDARHAIAVANGTAALHLAYKALGLTHGDEVVMPSLTFVASANTLIHCGSVPRFADVDAVENPVVSVSSLERAVTAKTRAITILHYGGFACAIDEIMEFARSRGLRVIEDAAHAPGAAWKGRKVGAWGDFGCFSFFGNKNLTCAEGGMIVTQDDALAAKVRALRSHGMTSLTWDRYKGHRHSYDVNEAGFNYRMDDLRASILRVQLGKLAQMNESRRRLSILYRERLGAHADWTLPFQKHTGESVHHLQVLVLSSDTVREQMIHQLKLRGIQTSIHYPPIHQFSFYRKNFPSDSDLKTTEALAHRLITLPLYPEMTQPQLETVCESVLEIADRMRI